MWPFTKKQPKEAVKINVETCEIYITLIDGTKYRCTVRGQYASMGEFSYVDSANMRAWRIVHGETGIAIDNNGSELFTPWHQVKEVEIGRSEDHFVEGYVP